MFQPLLPRLLRRAAVLSLALLTPLFAMAQAPDSTGDDPHLWLEDVQGERALAWVRERNAESQARLQAGPRYAPLRESLGRILDSRERIPAVKRLGPWLYNLWRDEKNPRGLWRRTTLDEFARPQPAWQTVLDLDDLARRENENWVWKGAECHGPSHRRCLLELSRGGADAVVLREFDVEDRRFVEGGFSLPEAKSAAQWLDADTLLVGTDFGPGSFTTSGYPRVIKRWQRGQPLAAATTVFEGAAGDTAVWPQVEHEGGVQRVMLQQSLDFYRHRLWLWQGGRLKAIDKPDTAQLQFWGSRVLLRLREDWTVAGRTHRAGSLLVADARAYLGGQRRFTVLFEPTPGRSLNDWVATRKHVVLNLLDHVAGRLVQWQAGPRGYSRRDVAAPHPGQLSLQALHDPQLKDDPLAENYLLRYTDFVQPDQLLLARTGDDARRPLKTLPPQFDDQGLRVEQHFATSRDGTKVPYFVVWPRGAQADGDRPTLLYGYGGFELSMLPRYSPVSGSAWVQQGGVYVLANIRGGGEYGPDWHRSAILQHKQRSYDDFIAVAEDLVARRVTRPARLGIMGGSNGGLLVGAVMLQRPDLFGAVVCQVPLLDMKRYHKLLAGASWVAEYGDPDKPEQWAWISKYSPYQNVTPRHKLPSVLLVTSTRDDRVHPGHARKMAARLREQGHPVLYFENIEGGHGGAADNAQLAHLQALSYSFLWQVLGPGAVP